MKMLYLTSDHGGFDLKNKIKNHLEKLGVQYIDLGPQSFNPDDDYPVFAKKLAEAVVSDKGEGIALCKTGVGMSIALNKFDGIRAAEVYTVEEAKKSKEHNDANVLVMGSTLFDDTHGLAILEAWLNTKFSGEERHIRRLSQIQKYEEEN